jgi:hypothetical protein
VVAEVQNSRNPLRPGSAKDPVHWTAVGGRQNCLWLSWSPTDGRDPDSSSTDSDERPAPAAYIKEGPLPISRRLTVGPSGWLCFLSLPSVNK